MNLPTSFPNIRVHRAVTDPSVSLGSYRHRAITVDGNDRRFEACTYDGGKTWRVCFYGVNFDRDGIARVDRVRDIEFAIREHLRLHREALIRSAA
jgi:hypothetical protein